MKKGLSLVLSMVVVGMWYSCTESVFGDQHEYDSSAIELALPLFNSELTIPKIAEASDVSSNVVVDPDGKVIITYLGEVIRRTSEEIFPPIPGLLTIDLADTVTTVPLPVVADDVIEYAVIGKTQLFFNMISGRDESLEVTVIIPQLRKEGTPFTTRHNLSGESANDLFETGLISIEGYELTPDANTIQVIYDARNTNTGSRVTLQSIRMGFDFFTFQRVEGRFDSRVFDIQGDIITVGIFDNWLSGGIAFENPSLTLEVENSFGLKTRSLVNVLDVVTAEGRNLDLESSILDRGIEFAYPDILEIGTTKTTIVEFTGDNSNIRELFAQRAASVTYDIDALINADDRDYTGFVTDDSYFNISVMVNLPLTGKVTDLVLRDRTSINFSEYEDVASLEFSVLASNEFPLDITGQVYFLDENATIFDSLFSNVGLLIPAAELNGDGRSTTPGTADHLESLDSTRVAAVLGASEIEVRGRFNSLPRGDNLSLFEDYRLIFKAGSKIKLK